MNLALGAPALADMSATTAAVVGALASVVGAVVGGLIGGMFAFWAVRRQLAFELAEKRVDESHKAAFGVANALWPLDMAFAMKRAGQDSDVQHASETFGRQAGAQIIAIADADLTQRIWNHVVLSYQYAGRSVNPDEEATALIDHSNQLRQAISAHYNRQPLPKYKPPPDLPSSPAS